MYFKQAAGRIFGVALSRKEEEALNREIEKQILTRSRQHEIETDSAILWMLHEHFGFGAQRLRRAWKLFYEQARALEEYYEMPSDGGWICQKKLEEIGCDVEQWYLEAEQERG